ncbi:MAG TPA: hypothetical protein VHZ76_07220 [Gammaproteobacteria bacterium]|jgi:hypothetical protein|nr:hypothetical protein [Gammaproteobacteria bacterium]
MIYRIYVKEINTVDFYCFSGEIAQLSWAKQMKKIIAKNKIYVEIEIRREDI